MRRSILMVFCLLVATPSLAQVGVQALPDEAVKWLYGRGALDTTSSGILHLATLIALHRSKLSLNRDVIFMATADEEAGGEHAARRDDDAGDRKARRGELIGWRWGPRSSTPGP